jgi:hypothetical protein
MHRELAEEAAEGLLLIRGEVLVPEEDHLAVDERVVHLLEGGLVERAGEVDAVDDGPDVGRELLDGQARVSHAGLLWARSCPAPGASSSAPEGIDNPSRS